MGGMLAAGCLPASELVSSRGHFLWGVGTEEADQIDAAIKRSLL